MNTPVQENVTETPKKNGGLVVTAFILAIVSCIVCWFVLAGWICWITGTLAIVFGTIGLIKNIIKKQKIVLAIISLALAVASFIIYYAMIAAAAAAVSAATTNALMNM